MTEKISLKAVVGLSDVVRYNWANGNKVMTVWMTYRIVVTNWKNSRLTN